MSKATLCFLVTFLFAVAALAAPQADSGSVSVEENVSYGSVNGTTLHLDVYKPAASNANHAAVILIHGGGWTSLDKSTMRGMGQFLARSGFVAFAVDYRLLQENGNRWPAQLDDVQRAVRWVRAKAAKYQVDPQRIGAFGHSAGGQLAALLGMEDTRDNSDAALAAYSSRVQAVVDVSGPSDFTVGRNAGGIEFLKQFIGSDQKAWRDASPVYRVAKGDAPFLIVHGTEDNNVPIARAEELYEKLQAAGVPASFIKVNDGHTFRTPEARHELAVESYAFFKQYLVGGK